MKTTQMKIKARNLEKGDELPGFHNMKVTDKLVEFTGCTSVLVGGTWIHFGDETEVEVIRTWQQ